MRTKLLIPALVLVLTALSAGREREFTMPPLIPATRMAAHDSHPQEKMAAGAEAYDTAAKTSIFHPALLRYSVLPVLVVFTNDGDEPILLTHAHFELVTRDRAKAAPYTMDDLIRAFPVRAPRSRPEDSLPIPLPGKDKAHGGLSQRDQDELSRSMLAAEAVEPHSSRQGFLFFDFGDLEDPARGARLYITGVRDTHGKELMYFEIPLKP